MFRSIFREYCSALLAEVVFTKTFWNWLYIVLIFWLLLITVVYRQRSNFSHWRWTSRKLVRLPIVYSLPYYTWWLYKNGGVCPETRPPQRNMLHISQGRHLGLSLFPSGGASRQGKRRYSYWPAYLRRSSATSRNETCGLRLVEPTPRRENAV